MNTPTPTEQKARIPDLVNEALIASLTPKERARCAELELDPLAFAKEKEKLRREHAGIPTDDDTDDDT